MEATATRSISGWGRTPNEECAVFRPERRRGVPWIFGHGGQPHYIARGLGRSYGDTAINPGGGVIDFTRLNRFLDFDPESGVVTCEAGVSFAELLDVFIPRGFLVPVTPGTKFVTVGGAIANDVHGKNHHRDGTIAQFLLSFQLLLPNGEMWNCSRDENPEVFWATLGGIGLTGVILTARIRLEPIETSFFNVDYYRASNIDDVLTKMRETQEHYQYSVAWVDCLAKGASLGRSVLMNGRHARRGDLSGAAASNPLGHPNKRQKSIPFNFPGLALNPLSIGAFNEVFYRAHPTVEGKLVDYDTYFYPLDAIHHWNRMYGKRGFTQYQIALPFSAHDALVDILGRVSKSGRASFLAVLKCFGPSNEGPLSFPIPGYTLTLDFAMRKDLPAWLHELDKILLEHGGRLYLAKDVCMKPETFAAMYPNLDAFRAVRDRLDPNHTLQSHMARRLGI